MSNKLIAKLESFSLSDWLGVISIIMESASIREVEISAKVIDELSFGKQYLAMSGLECGGFSMTLIPSEDVPDNADIIIPDSHTIQ